MLKTLKINNYALIDSIEISFDMGMTSITGETGAGKSIILGGLSMVLGSRIDNSKIINKNKKCFVEAVFDLKDLNPISSDYNQIDFINSTLELTSFDKKLKSDVSVDILNQIIKNVKDT